MKKLSGLIGIRDKALLLIGFAGAFRRSELVAIMVEDIRFVPEGLVIRIGRSKTDQIGLGRNGPYQLLCPSGKGILMGCVACIQ